MTFCYHQALKGSMVFCKFLRNNQMKSEVSGQLFSFKKSSEIFFGKSLENHVLQSTYESS